MVDIQSKEVIDKISDELKVQPSMQIPRELAKLIQLVYNVNPDREIKAVRGIVSGATSGTIHTTSATKDTFLIGTSLSVTKDAVNTGLGSNITATPFGAASTPISEIRYLTTTAAQDLSQVIMLPQPLKLERDTTIDGNHESATAIITSSILLFFYEVDPL